MAPRQKYPTVVQGSSPLTGFLLENRVSNCLGFELPPSSLAYHFHRMWSPLKMNDVIYIKVPQRESTNGQED